MKFLTDFLVYGVFNLNPETAIGKTASFFVYDSIKLLLLLVVMIYVLSFLRTYLPAEKIRQYLGGKNKIRGALFAALFGAITPFCTCSSIPIFISFLKLRLPLASVFAFLITSPLVNQYVVAIMPGMIGVKITLLYITIGIGVGVVAGLLLDKMNLAKNFEQDFSQTTDDELDIKVKTFSERHKFSKDEVFDVVKKLWKWLLLGVAIGAIIHNFIPKESVETISNATKPFDVILITLIAVPMYGSCVAVIPIAIALFKKGIALGTAFAFMMSFSGLSFPEAVILRRVMNLKLIGIFFGVVFLAIVFMGYLLNFLEPYLVG